MTRQKATGARAQRGLAVPDLDRKLQLLYKRMGYGVDRSKRRILINDRTSLCTALGVDRSQLTRWTQADRIPRLKIVQELGSLFSFDPRWLEEPYERFEQLLLAGIPRLSPWDTLLDKAREEDSGTILQLEPPPHRVLTILPEGASRRLPVVELGSLVRVTFNTPQSSDGASLWKSWYATLLSEGSDGFFCILPRYKNERTFVYPEGARFPGQPLFMCEKLLIQEKTRGLYSVVLLAHQHPLPDNIQRALMEAREGDSLRPVLDELATHLLPLCVETRQGSSIQPASAAILRIRFRAH